MIHRSAAAALAISLAISLPGVALADVPPAADGGTVDPSCTVAAQSVAGETCQECQPSNGSCQEELGGDYLYACTYSSTVQVWCIGPARTDPQSPGCTLGAAPARGGALAMLVGAAALALARRRRASKAR